MALLTEVEQGIMNYIQKQIKVGNRITLSQTASDCHVAPSTIVKMSKKVGYSGFVELYHYLYHQHEEEKIKDFQNDLIEGDLRETLRALAALIKKCEGKKNLIGVKEKIGPAARYFSRKLQLFDIFAPASNDYALTSFTRLPRGCAFFLEKDFDKINIELFRLAVQEGYYIVVITETPPEKMLKNIDFLVRIKKTHYKTADFYTAKVLVFMEMLLSEYAGQGKEGSCTDAEIDGGGKKDL